MQITRKSIEEAAKDQETLQAGRRLYEKGMAVLGQADSFWKNEVYVTASVRDGDNIYKPRIFIRNGGVASCRCGCPENHEQGQLCRHGAAAAFAYLEAREKEGQKPVTASFQTREIIKGYSDRERGEILSGENGGPLSLIPHAAVQGGQIRLSFGIGVGGKTYPIRDLEAFAQSVRTGAGLSCGKNTELYLGPGSFSPESRKMAELVCGLAEEREAYGRREYGGLRREWPARFCCCRKTTGTAFST